MYLGLDLGTSGLRALLVDQEGSPVLSAQRSYSTQHPNPSWSEQNPLDWLKAVDEVMLELGASHPSFKNLKGIAVSGHMHGATLLDEKGSVIRPCILWNDTRSSLEAQSLDTSTNRELSGNIVFAGFTAPKLLWVKRHDPQSFARISKVLLPAGYINFHLTGNYVGDFSDASGTSWLNVKEREWSDELLTAGQMSRAQTPSLVEGCAPVGVLRDALAQRWGLGSVVIAGGAGDNAASACGIGALSERQGFVSLGTSGVLLVARDQCIPAPETALHTFCHAIPDRWYQMGVILAATDSLNWLSSITGIAPASLTAELGASLRSPSSIRFLPYLSGERTPHNDTIIRGSFTGLSAAHQRLDLTQAVLEGVAFGLRDSLEALKLTGAKVERLTAIGGGSGSIYWLKLLATVLQIPLEIPAGKEFGAALGAARLAMAATNGGDAADYMSSPKIESTVYPDGEKIVAFDEAFEKFRATYPAIKSIQ